MIKINRYNYESYFLDYLENNLSAQEIESLNLFLSQNPDLQNELDEFQYITLESDNISYDNKFSLKKPKDVELSDIKYDQYLMISKLEGDISNEESDDLNNLLINDSNKIDDYSLYLKTISTTDNNIKYKNKSLLKRKSINIVNSFIYTISSAAAIIIFFFLLNINKQNYIAKSVEFNENNNYTYFRKVKYKEKQKIRKIDYSKNINSVNLITDNQIVAKNQTKRTKYYKLEISNSKRQLAELSFTNTEKYSEQNISSILYNNINKEKRFKIHSRYISPEQHIVNNLKKKIRNRKISFYSMSRSIIKKLNKLTGRKMKLTKTKHSNGDEYLNFYSKNFEFSKKIQNNN